MEVTRSLEAAELGVTKFTEAAELDVKILAEATNSKVLPDTASNRTLYNDKYITQLKKTLRQTVRKNRLLEKRLKIRAANLNKLFNKDQISFLANGGKMLRGTTWSSNIINMRLYLACGRKRYKEIFRQNLPYPDIDTLQRLIPDLKF